MYQGASELYKESQTNDILTCLEQCQGFELAIISKINITTDSGKNFNCKCVNYYKIRMQDISSDCLQWWCPSIKGKNELFLGRIDKFYHRISSCITSNIKVSIKL